MTANDRTLTFLTANGVPLLDRNTVTTDLDGSCDMAQVSVNGQVVMVGNLWDFHPGCHGFNLPGFHGHEELTDLFVKALTAHVGEVVQTVNEDWVYEG